MSIAYFGLIYVAFESHSVVYLLGTDRTRSGASQTPNVQQTTRQKTTGSQKGAAWSKFGGVLSTLLSRGIRNHGVSFSQGYFHFQVRPDISKSRVGVNFNVSIGISFFNTFIPEVLSAFWKKITNKL